MFASILPRRKTHRNDADELSYSCLDIARHRRLLLNCFIMCSLWYSRKLDFVEHCCKFKTFIFITDLIHYKAFFSRAASGIIYFGLSLSTSELAGDKYLNFFFSGAVEAPAYLSTVYLLQRWLLSSSAHARSIVDRHFSILSITEVLFVLKLGLDGACHSLGFIA